MELLTPLQELGLLGILLAVALWVIAYLYRSKEKLTNKTLVLLNKVADHLKEAEKSRLDSIRDDVIAQVSQERIEDALKAIQSLQEEILRVVKENVQ